MLISLFPTPFDHFHFHGSAGLVLTPCRIFSSLRALHCSAGRALFIHVPPLNKPYNANQLAEAIAIVLKTITKMIANQKLIWIHSSSRINKSVITQILQYNSYSAIHRYHFDIQILQHILKHQHIIIILSILDHWRTNSNPSPKRTKKANKANKAY